MGGCTCCERRDLESNMGYLRYVVAPCVASVSIVSRRRVARRTWYVKLSNLEVLGGQQCVYTTVGGGERARWL